MPMTVQLPTTVRADTGARAVLRAGFTTITTIIITTTPFGGASG